MDGLSLVHIVLDLFYEKDTTCGGDSLNLTCPETSYLHILATFFGSSLHSRYIDTHVDKCGHDKAKLQDNCYSTSAHSKIKSACEGKTSCSKQVRSSNLGGDPCQFKQKYLDVLYKCVSNGKYMPLIFGCEKLID